MGSITLPKLLVVNFINENLKPGTSAWSSTCKDIRDALENHGCFIAVYDGVSSKVQESVFQAADELFDLPVETKIKNIMDKPFPGYIGQIPFIPLYESLAIDYSTELEAVQSFTDIMWPNGNQSSFCETSLLFSRALAKLEHIVIRMLFESYNVEKHIEDHINSTTYLIRYMKYRAPEMNESTMAMPCHTDNTFMTILYQNQVSGLEIKSRDGEWISVEFPPSSFVVMAGEPCKAWSNNRVLAPIHKVTLNQNQKETRYGIGLFSFLSKKVEVPDEFVDDEHPLQFKPFDIIDLLKFYNTEHGQKSQNLLKDFCGV